MLDVVVVDAHTGNEVARLRHLSLVEFIILIHMQLSLPDEYPITNNL
jgi:hypothetical protein